MPLRVLILKDVLSAKTGGTKLTIDIAKAFQSIGVDVKVVFFHSDGTEQMLRGEYGDVPMEVFESSTLFKLSQIVQIPVLKLFLKDAFKIEDAINLLGQVTFARRLNKRSSDYDMIISMSLWTGLVAMFLTPSKRRHSLLYFHEPPTFGGLPFPLRVALRTYLLLALKAVTLNVATTEIMVKLFKEAVGVDCAIVKDSFRAKPLVKDKDDFVLVDTRWTFVRNPFFLIDIAKESPGIRFVMCGRFGSQELKERFLKELETNRVEDRIAVRDENTEEELDYLYSRAKCYLRWSGQIVNEAGPSYGLIQAVSNGCIPIVSDNLGSSVDVRNNIGSEFVVRNDSSEFAAAILRLFSDDEYQRAVLEKVILWRNGYTGKEYARRLLSLTGLRE